MSVLAHTDSLVDELTSSSEALDWGSPVGLGVFIVGIALTLAILAWTIRTLAAVDREQGRRK